MNQFFDEQTIKPTQEEMDIFLLKKSIYFLYILYLLKKLNL